MQTTAPPTMAMRIAVLAAALFQIVTPLLPLVGIGEQVGSQSNGVRTLITPATWAFVIWGPLYAGTIAFAIFQLLPAQQSSALLAPLRRPAMLAFLGNAIWVAYTQVYGLSIVSVAIIAFTLINMLAIYRRLAGWRDGFAASERWAVVLPLSALAAWLSAATIVNIAAALRFHGVEAGDNAPLIGGVIVTIGGVIASLALLGSQGNPPYALTFLWALAAIYLGPGQVATPVAWSAIVSMFAVAAATVVGLMHGGWSRWMRGAPVA